MCVHRASYFLHIFFDFDQKAFACKSSGRGTFPRHDILVSMMYHMMTAQCSALDCRIGVLGWLRCTLSYISQRTIDGGRYARNLTKVYAAESFSIIRFVPRDFPVTSAVRCKSPNHCRVGLALRTSIQCLRGNVIDFKSCLQPRVKIIYQIIVTLCHEDEKDARQRLESRGTHLLDVSGASRQ